MGTFTQDVAGAALAASVLCDGWSVGTDANDSRPVLGVPEGPYLEQVDATVRAGFERAVERLIDAGYEVRREAMLGDIEEVGVRHRAMVSAEFVEGHAEVHEQYASMYRAGSATSLDQGRSVTAEELAVGRASIPALRAAVEGRMEETGIDALVCPSSVTVAPEGLGSTGNPAMNMPWTHSGMPAVTLPSGLSEEGLPLGTQVVGRFMSDERLLGWCEGIGSFC